jgi:hypothetical protein
MSIIMTLQVSGDPQGMERFASENQDAMRAVLDAATRHGLIAHRFYGSDDGSMLMVLDEWPDRDSFEAFFREQESQIRPMFEAVRATSEPQPLYWRELETHDAFGWGA